MVRGEKGGALNHRMRMNEGNLTQSCEDSSSAMIVNPLCQLQLHAFGSPGAKLPRDDARSLGDGSWGTTRSEDRHASDRTSGLVGSEHELLSYVHSNQARSSVYIYYIVYIYIWIYQYGMVYHPNMVNMWKDSCIVLGTCDALCVAEVVYILPRGLKVV